MVQSEATIRVLIGKVGFDPHDRGILVLSRGLRNAGMEVIFLGKFMTAPPPSRRAPTSSP